MEAQGASTWPPPGNVPVFPGSHGWWPRSSGTGLGKGLWWTREAPQQQPSSGGPRPSPSRSLGVYGLTQSRQLREGLKSPAWFCFGQQPASRQGFPSRLGLKGRPQPCLRAPTRRHPAPPASHPALRGPTPWISSFHRQTDSCPCQQVSSGDWLQDQSGSRVHPRHFGYRLFTKGTIYGEVEPPWGAEGRWRGTGGSQTGQPLSFELEGRG